MNIDELIVIIKKKITDNVILEEIKIEDKSFLHKNHLGNQEGKFHIKLTIKSKELKQMNNIDKNKKIYKILDNELKNYIHSIQILID